MLQNMRDNMKGTLVVIVIILFIVPMVIGGVGGGFLGSAAGTEAAEVEGRGITNTELARAIFTRRQTIVSQTGADASAEYLNDENLRQPVLDNLTRRLALVRTAEKNGMGVSDIQLSREITSQEEFRTDNKFDREKYVQLLRGAGFTPALYREQVVSSLLLDQQNFSLDYSSFVTPDELDQIVKVVEQKRTFYSVKIPKSTIEESVVIEDSEIQSYYDVNKNDFIEAEKIKVSYIDLSIDDIAKSVDVNDADVKAQYEQEVEAFEANTQYEVSHILVESADDDSSTTKIDELKQKINSDSFSDLAKNYSDDLASKDSGGSLGVMTLGMFPSAFENAVLGMEEGQVSEPVETESGTHFIKVDKKLVAEAPAFDDRKDIIKSQLARAVAEEQFVSQIDELGELTFSAPDLKDAADRLGLEVKETSYFEKNSGSGIALEAAVRETAFSPDVLETSNNSKVIELGNERAIVLKLVDHQKERVKDLSAVTDEIKADLLTEKMNASLKVLAEQFEEKASIASEAEVLAKEMGYDFARFEDVKRQDISVDREASDIAFRATVSEPGTTYENASTRDGGFLLVGIESVVDGSQADIDAQQLENLKRQLASQNSSSERASFEALVVEKADIQIN